jgi:hypothetical protein
MDPEAEATEFFKTILGEPGEPVPVVDVADLKAMWTFTQEWTAKHGNRAVGLTAYTGPQKQICSPGADVRAVNYRCTLLRLIEMTIRPMWAGGDVSDAALKVAATMDLKWMAMGVVYSGTDMNEFLAQVHQETAA